MGYELWALSETAHSLIYIYLIYIIYINNMRRLLLFKADRRLSGS